MNAFKYQRNLSLYSVQRQISDGNLEVVTVRVPYEDKATLHVLVDDVQITSSLVQGSPYTWQWDSDTIRITPKVASGSQVLVRRVSPADAMKNIFNGQAEFTDESMDENFKQLLWLAQEYGEGSGLHDVFSNINMHGYKITNVGRATDDDDVVTFGQYKDDALGAWQAAQQAKEALQQGKQILDRAQTVADSLEQTNAEITQKWQQTEQQIDTAISEMNSTVQSGKQTIETLKNQTIQDINDAKGQIGGSITEAHDAANLAKQWATKVGDTVDGQEYSSKHYSQISKSQADRTQAIADEVQSIAGGIVDAAEEVKVVAKNIQSVKTDALNIDKINVVAGDFQGNTNPISMPEWGEVGVEQPSVEVPTGGNIYNVSMNMQHVRKDAQNMDYIIKVANGLDNIPDDVANIQKYVKRAQTAKTGAETAKEGAQAAKTSAESATTKAQQWANLMDTPIDGAQYSARMWASYDGVVTGGKGSAYFYMKKTQEVLNSATSAIASAKDSAVSQITSNKDSALGALQEALGAHTTALQQVGTQEAQKVQQQGSTSVSAVTTEGTKQIQAVTAQGTTQINLAKAQVDLAKAEVTKATEQATAAQSSAATATQAASQASSYKDLANSYKNQSQSGSNRSWAWAQKMGSPVSGQQYSSKYWASKSQQYSQNAQQSKTDAAQIANTAKSQADRARTQADRAQEAADNASREQIQADWNQTDSTKKDFIKNKPALGALASKDTLNYSEITGTPPAPDLRPYALKTELQPKADKTYVDTELAKKQPTGNYALKSDLTSKADVTTLQSYWKKTDTLPMPEYGQVGVN